MRDLPEMMCARSNFCRSLGIIVGTLASLYVATKGIQYISRKLTDKRRNSLRPSTSSAETTVNTSNSSSNITRKSISETSAKTIITSPSSARKKQQQQSIEFDTCSICHKKFNIANVDDRNSTIDNIVSCNVCSLRACKDNPKCAIWLSKHNRWECNDCHQFNSVVYVQAYDWIFERLNRKFDDKIVGAVTNTPEPPLHVQAANNQNNNDDDDYDDDVMLELELNGDNSPIPLQQRVRVREFIEDLIGSMLGGSLDDVCVGQLFKNLEYLKLFLLYHCELSHIIYKLEVSLHQALSSDLPITEDHRNPGASYENLRKIIHAVVQEVIKLPEFYNQKGFSSVDANQVRSSFEPKIYEDLLATAVINKIVDTYNDKKYENSSGIHSGGSDLDSNNERANGNFSVNSRCSSTEPKSEASALHSNERLRSMSMKTADIIDEIFREKLGKENYHSSSPSASVRSELSDYIQNHKIALPEFEIEEDCSCAEEDSDDIEEEFQSIYAANSELDANTSEISDNWLFRKVSNRNCMNGSVSSVVSASPVGMLVPSPTQDCRTLIGDRNADEISDLSEIGSDGDFSDDERNRSGASITDLPHVLVGSKTLIGGKNEMNSFEQSKAALIDLLEPASLVSVQSLTGQSPAVSEAKNNLILIEDRGSEKECSTMDSNGAFNSKATSSNHYELINFDSFDENENKKQSVSQESNDVEIITKAQKRMDFEPVPAPRSRDETNQKFTDLDILTTNDSISIEKPILVDSVDEYNDSLEQITFDSNHATDVKIRANVSEDVIEQDSLDSNKDDSVKPASGYSSPLIPIIAQLEETLARTESASSAQNRITNTNPFETNDKSIESNNHQTNRSNSSHDTKHKSASDAIEFDFQDLPGSIAEREHMKWKNAVDFPNNPYSAEALQRRLSQTSTNKFTDIERLASKFEAHNDITSDSKAALPKAAEKPIKVVLGSNELSAERYRRDYYINDAKAASGSRAQKTCGDLNLHRSIDDMDDDDETNTKLSAGVERRDDLDEMDNSGGDSLLVGDIEVVSTNRYTAAATNIDNSERFAKVNNQSSSSLLKARPIQVAENDPILNKATKLDHLCTGDRDYYLLEGDATTSDEYAKLSLGSEDTETDVESHVNHSSLVQCDSLSTNVSEESECTAAVRVYDLNKRETKILRHDIIKRSRNPVGGEANHFIDSPFGNFDNCCDVNHKSGVAAATNKSPIPSPLNTTINEFNSRILENANEARKPPRSPTKLKSIHLNRNPRKLKMSDVQQVNEAFGTSLDASAIVDELKSELKARESSVASATEQFLEHERKSDPPTVIYETVATIVVNENNHHNNNGHVIDDANHNDNNNNDSSNGGIDSESKQTNHHSEQTTELVQTSDECVNGAVVLEQCDNGIAGKTIETEEIVTKSATTETILTETSVITTETMAIITSTTSNNDLEAIERIETIETSEPDTVDHVEYRTDKYERHNDVVVRVSEHLEKSVIEDDVKSVLPSVKALAQTFSAPKDQATTPRLNRPKVWRHSNDGSNNNDISVKNQNENGSDGKKPSPDSFVPQFNHSYHPVSPGYSITARSLSTKFREELKNSTGDNGTGRQSPERPSSPVLVPGILKNNIAFFENLRNK